jgi:hypothetical protein
MLKRHNTKAKVRRRRDLRSETAAATLAAYWAGVEKKRPLHKPSHGGEFRARTASTNDAVRRESVAPISRVTVSHWETRAARRALRLNQKASQPARILVFGVDFSDSAILRACGSRASRQVSGRKEVAAVQPTGLRLAA